MTHSEICPNCRSTYEVSGNLDFGAPALQSVNCPVCSQSKWLASGLWPQQWVVGKVLTRQPVLTSPQVIPPPADDTANWTFQWPELGQTAVANAGQGLYKIGIWVVVVLVLVVLIRYAHLFKD